MAKRRYAKKNAKEITAAAKTAKLDTEQEKPLIVDSINSEAFAAAMSTASRVMMKVCRLCETKDGPFLNIFGAENMTAKKIDDLMPFVVAENDDLPHKICFRCSAKVEELYEFIQKCTHTQQSLRKVLGKNEPIPLKVKPRTLWEEKLNESNISNDDICNALIRKAMEGIKDIPFMSQKEDEKELSKNDLGKGGKSKEKEYLTKEHDMKRSSTRLTQNSHKEEDQQTLKTNTKNGKEVLQLKFKKNDNEVSKLFKVSEKKDTEESKPSKVFEKKRKNVESSDIKEISVEESENKPFTSINTCSSSDEEKKEKTDKPFDIMDHVSTIKVNGVGILFQCKLCNRNFLKKEVVINHGCAKNGGKKIAEEIKTIAPEPPKIPLIKYINTKTNKDSINNAQVLNNSPINIDDDDEDDIPLVVKKPKPRIGPASKINRREDRVSQTSSMTTEETAKTIANAIAMPQQTIAPGTLVFPGSTCSTPTFSTATFQVPLSMPKMNIRYKLVPGPNNSVMLVEDKPDCTTIDTTLEEPSKIYSTPIPNMEQPTVISNNTPAKKCVTQVIPAKPQKTPTEQPYPVGLIKKVSHQPTFPKLPETFTTPAMKKQSYTVVQTGNPSKLLISAKPQPQQELPKKKSRKSPPAENNQKPCSLEVNDNQLKNAEFFTFVNVDPILQPSYVLPTDNIIQESQISTSTAAKPADPKEQDRYSCNMCNEKFTREKKLLTHIQSHYKKMDEEDLLRAQKNPKKRRAKT